jgi:hypothetical protein
MIRVKRAWDYDAAVVVQSDNITPRCRGSTPTLAIPYDPSCGKVELSMRVMPARLSASPTYWWCIGAFEKGTGARLQYPRQQTEAPRDPRTVCTDPKTTRLHSNL